MQRGYSLWQRLIRNRKRSLAVGTGRPIPAHAASPVPPNSKVRLSHESAMACAECSLRVLRTTVYILWWQDQLRTVGVSIASC